MGERRTLPRLQFPDISLHSLPDLNGDPLLNPVCGLGICSPLDWSGTDDFPLGADIAG